MIYWALFFVVLFVELHPKIPTQNCLTKAGLFMLQLSAIGLSAGKDVTQWLAIGVIITLIGFAHRHIIFGWKDRRQA